MLRHMQTHILAAAVAALSLSQVNGAKLCWMLFQMADNNLEAFIRADNYELIQSDIVKSASLNTWVYFDARNYLNNNQDITEPLEEVYSADGSTLLSDAGDKYTGSRYLHWENGKMIAETTLAGELNSDSPAVMTSYFVHALEDCVSWGADQWMLSFGSHGGGFAGFGSDDNKSRKLLAANANIVGAIRSALNQVSGAPSKLDVIGFDACLMQAFGALDDFRTVTKYLLASQAVEPGHGWAYDTLTSSSGLAVDLAKDIIDQYVESMQGLASHRTPKILALASSDDYDVFLAKFELLMAEMVSIIEAKNDPGLYSMIGRARAESLAFEGIVDDYGTKTPSALDIGSFLTIFQTMCNPTGTLGTLLQDAIDAYDTMIVYSRYGEGTAPATGMQITFPFKSDYLAYQSLWDTVLFNVASYRTDAAPNYQQFLKSYLQSTTPTTNTSQICGSPTGDVVVDDGSILVQPSAEVLETIVQVNTDISQGCDYVSVEYGVDLTTPLGPFLESLGLESSANDYLFLYGGDVLGSFLASEDVGYSAVWDRLFYFLTIDTSSFEALYVFDYGNGYKTFPVLYVPPDKANNLGTVQFLDFLLWSLSDWESNVGAIYGFCTFSRNPSNGIIDQNLVLYVKDEASSTATDQTAFSAIDASVGGYIIPIIYVNAFIADYAIEFLPGGFNQTILTWSEDINYQIIARTDERVIEVTGADAVITDINAIDFDWVFEANGSDYASFDIIGTARKDPLDLTTDDGIESTSFASTRSIFGAGLSVVLTSMLFFTYM